ncbi:MAG: hypothetical protein ACYCWE_01950 [Eubacteriales bacterium]
MFRMKNILSILLVLLLTVMLTVPTAMSVFAEAEVTEAETDPSEVTEVAQETTVEETTAAVDEPVSDLSNIIGIAVAVVIGVGAVVAVILLAPKNKAPKRK